MGDPGSEAHLKQELSIHLGWDEMIIDSVMQNIKEAKSMDDVQELIEVCTSPGPPARAFVAGRARALLRCCVTTRRAAGHTPLPICRSTRRAQHTPVMHTAAHALTSTPAQRGLGMHAHVPSECLNPALAQCPCARA